jgi:hypothetical protein
LRGPVRLPEWIARSTATEWRRFGVVVLFWALLAATFLRLLVEPWAAPFAWGDTVTPASEGSLQVYLSNAAGPWNPWWVGGTPVPFYTNSLVGVSLEAIVLPVAQSAGGGILLLAGGILMAQGIGGYLGARLLGLRFGPAVLASFAFAASPWAFDRTVSGHELILLAGAFLPVLLALWVRGLERGLTWRAGLVAGIALGAVGILEFHVLYLAFVAFALLLVAELGIGVRRLRARSRPDRALPRTAQLRAIAHEFGPWAAVPLVAMGLGFVWVWPTLAVDGLTNQGGVSPATIAEILGYSQFHATGFHILTGVSYVYPYYLFAFYPGAYLWVADLLLGALAVVLLLSFVTALYLARVSSLALVVLSAVFLLLAAGTVVLGPLYLIFVREVPLFAILDDPNKSYLVVLASSSLLIGWMVDLWTRPGPTPTLGGSGPVARVRTLAHRHRSFAPIAAGAIVLAVVLAAGPWWGGSLGGYVPREPGTSFEPQSAWISAHVPAAGAVALFPPTVYSPVYGQTENSPLAYDPTANMVFASYTSGLEALPAVGRMVDWSYASFYSNSTEYAGSLFGLLGVTAWDVNTQYPNTGDATLYFANSTSGPAAIAAQKDLGPPQSVGEFAMYRPADASPDAVSIRDSSYVALADREVLLDAAYLPGGNAWLQNASLFYGLGAAPNTTGVAPNLLETPEGMTDAIFGALPGSDVVPLEPLAWQALGTRPYDVLTTGDWLPWEVNPGIEEGRALAALPTYAESDGSVPLVVPLPPNSPAGSDLWVDALYGPQEGKLDVVYSSGTNTTLNANSPTSPGFAWIDLGPVPSGAHSIRLIHTGPGYSAVASVAEVTPAEFSSVESRVESQLTSANFDQTILWDKGETSRTWGGALPVYIGADFSERWGTRLPANSGDSSEFFVPVASNYTAWMRASGPATLEVSICPAGGSSPLSCTASAPVGAANSTPGTLAPFSIPVPAGWVNVTVRSLAGTAVLDELVLTRDLPNPSDPTPGVCASGAAAPLPICGAPVLLPASATSPSTADSYSAILGSPAPAGGVVVRLTNFDDSWRLTTNGTSVAPFEVDGWALGFPVPPGAVRISITLPALASSEEEGALGSAFALAVTVVVFVGTERKRRGGRGSGGRERRSGEAPSPPPRTRPPAAPERTPTASAEE